MHVENNFTHLKNIRAPSINATLWHYLGINNFNFRGENNSINQGNTVTDLTFLEIMVMWMPVCWDPPCGYL